MSAAFETRRWLAAALVMCVTTAPLTATGQELSPVGEEPWLLPTDELRIPLDRDPASLQGLAVVVGTTDVSNLIRIDGHELLYAPAVLPLPSGESEVVVYEVRGPNEWTEIARRPIRVLTPLGFERAEVTPQLNIEVTSQLAERRNRDAGPSEQDTPNADLNVQWGFASAHRRNGLEVESAFDGLGVTRRERALQFNERQDDAWLIDLANYRLSGGRGPMRGGVGHLTFGNHRYLADSFTSRGVQLSYRLADSVDASFAMMSARTIVGWNNFFGVADVGSDNMRAGTLGVDLFRAFRAESLQSRFGTWRLEGTLTEGRRAPEASFNTGEVVDSEESFGFGFRLVGQSPTGRLRGDFVFGRSTFDNPGDDLELVAGLDVVPVSRSTDNARFLQVAYDVLRDLSLPGERTATVTLTAQHERVDPLYRTLVAFVSADQMTNDVFLDASLGYASLQGNHSWIEDNLDDVAAVLTTRTRSTNLNLSVPVATWFSSAEEVGNPWWPSVVYSFNRTLQRGDGIPEGFRPDLVPDQLTTLHSVGVDWTANVWSFGYRYSLNLQDNEQPERENADFTNRSHEVSIGARAFDALGVNLFLGVTDADDDELGVTRYTKSGGIGFDWQFLQRWSVNGNYAYTDEDDSRNAAIARSHTFETQLAFQFELPRIGRRNPSGRLFVRHFDGSNVNRDRTFAVATDARFWLLNAGFSLSY